MKKIISLIFSVAIANIAWSQEVHVSANDTLYVSPKAFVFVTNSINVVASGDIAVDSDATNSGSLIVKGNDAPGASNSAGSVTYRRHIKDANWHFVSAPVTTQSINSFATNTANSVRVSGTGNYGISTYNNEAAQGSRWEYYTAATLPTAGNFVNGKGYSNLRAAAGQYAFTGEIDTQDVSITIPAEVATTTAHLWTLIGNPYTSFLPANEAAATDLGMAAGDNILSQNIAKLDPALAYIQVWDGSSYQIINLGSGAYYLAPGQGFMVDAVLETGAQFIFDEDLQMPEVGGATTFYRTSPKPEVVLKLSNGTDTKKTTLYYLDSSTTGLDVGYDAGTFQDGSAVTFSLDTHLVSDSEGIDFTLQYLPTSDFETSIVPLSVIAAADQTLTFSAEAANLPTGLEVYLEDKVANTITNISTASHQVTLDAALNGIGRFYVHTSSSVLSIEDEILASTLNIYKTSNTNLRITSLQQQGNATVKMYTVLGKEVASHSFNIKSVNNVAIPSNLSKGVYLVNLVTNGAKQTKKIIIE
jgi:hypothetical protein